MRQARVRTQRKLKRNANVSTCGYQEGDEEDVRLIQSYRNGNEKALSLLLQKYRNIFLYRFKKTHGESIDDEIIEDIVQEALIRIVGAIDRFDEAKGKFFMWAFTVAANLFKNQTKTKRKLDRLFVHQVSEEIVVRNRVFDGVDTGLSPIDAVISKEAVKQICAAISLLPKSRQQILFLRSRGDSYDEIAEKLSMEVGTVKSQMNRARNSVISNLPPDLAKKATQLRRFGYT